MARPRKDPEITPPDENEAKSRGDRFTVQLDPDGSIAWDRMRPSTRDELLGKLRNDPRIGTIASGAPVDSGSDQIFNAGHVGMVFDMLGRLEVSIAMRTYRITQEQAEVLLYSDAEKRILTDPLIKVLNKYGATWFSKYGDEIALAGLLVAIHAPKIERLRQPPAKAPIPMIVKSEVEKSS